MKGFTATDDYLHEPNEHRDWRESFYFNWVDLNTRICGFSTIGILPNIPKREFVFALFIDDNPNFHLAEPQDAIPEDFIQALWDGHLSFELVKPFEEWRIHFTNPRVSVEIHWRHRFPAYDFGPGSGTSWGRHLEQSGHISGQIVTPDGHLQQFQGLGQRDKSWGVRNWHIDEWYALQAQFEDTMIGLRYDIIHGKGHLSGCVSRVDENVALTKIQVETEFEEDPIRKPVRVLTRLKDAKGNHYILTSKLIAPMTFARYARQFPGGETELFETMVVHECDEIDGSGTGLAEWLFTHHE